VTSTKNDHVSTSQGACVFCNTVRPIDEVLCPACGRGWIDTSASDSADSVARAESAAIRTISTGAALEIRRANYRKAWWVPILVAAVVFGVYWALVTIIGGTAGTEPEPVTVPTTLGPTTTAAVELPPTTLPPPQTPPTTVTPSTTTTTTAVTTTTVPPLAAGDPIPIDDLRLGAIELGEFAFGSPAAELLARLVGTFGQPTSISDASPEWGICSDDGGQVFTFGGLHVVTIDAPGGADFAGFVVEESGTASDGLSTFSGVGLGTTIAEMDEVYRSFQTSVAGGTTTWIVSSFNDGHTLLWGTAAGDSADAVVDRIASPRACDGGPASG
jgi:hypothetical protein